MIWSSETDSFALAKQIVRIAVRIGANDIAEQYMLRCGTEDRDLLILKLQVTLKAARPGKQYYLFVQYSYDTIVVKC